MHLTNLRARAAGGAPIIERWQGPDQWQPIWTMDVQSARELSATLWQAAEAAANAAAMDALRDRFGTSEVPPFAVAVLTDGSWV